MFPSQPIFFARHDLIPPPSAERVCRLPLTPKHYKIISCALPVYPPLTLHLLASFNRTHSPVAEPLSSISSRVVQLVQNVDPKSEFYDLNQIYSSTYNDSRFDAMLRHNSDLHRVCLSCQANTRGKYRFSHPKSTGTNEQIR